eukprot:170122_1
MSDMSHSLNQPKTGPKKAWKVRLPIRARSVPMYKKWKRTQKQSKFKASLIKSIVNGSGQITIKVYNNANVRNIVGKIVNQSGQINIKVFTNGNTDAQTNSFNNINCNDVKMFNDCNFNGPVTIGDSAQHHNSYGHDSDYSDDSYDSTDAIVHDNDALTAMRKRVADIEAEAMKISAMSYSDNADCKPPI